MGGRIGVGESGRARIDIFPLLLIIGVLLIMMAFLENAGAEVIGGVIGGLVVLYAGSLWFKFSTFQIRFLSHTEPITAEHAGEHTALRTDVGTSVFNVCIKPRKGIELEKYGFAFFEKGKLPWLVGRRCSTENAEITQMRFFNDRNRTWEDAPLTKYYNEGCFAEKPILNLAGGSRAYYALEVRVASSLKSWEGVLSFKLFYQRDGNPETKKVRTKFFVRSPDKHRPMRSLFKKVLKCEPTPLISGEVKQDGK